MESKGVLEALENVGQIQKGDAIHLEFKGAHKEYLATEILNSGTEKEEVILDSKKNIYFITPMAIDGSSWSKNVRVISN